MAHKAKSLFLVLYKPSWLASGLSETLMIFPPLAEGKGTEQTMDWFLKLLPRSGTWSFLLTFSPLNKTCGHS